MSASTHGDLKAVRSRVESFSNPLDVSSSAFEREGSGQTEDMMPEASFLE